MRIAIANWSRRRVGGTETYLDSIIPELHRRGHAVAFWSETDQPEDREPVMLPPGGVHFNVASTGLQGALDALRRWAPDVVYAHGFLEPRVESQVQTIAPAIFFAHNFYGTCISGHKARRLPTLSPCSARFGLGCFLHFYPHRCGGWSPSSLLKQYRTQSRRLRLLSGYQLVLTASEHMRNEYLRHDLPSDRLRQIGLPIQSHKLETAESRRSTLDEGPLRLLFAGRMDYLKGGRILLDAIAVARSRLGRPLHLVLAGSGPDLEALGKRAVALQADDPQLSIEFTGWVDSARLQALFAQAHLLVLPSLWPEPFGMVGLEAGLHRLPTAAFAVGGIPDWLKDGVNGYLAPGDRPSARGLAEAIVKCVHDPEIHRQLREGAIGVARQFSMERHLAALMQVFEEVVDRDPAADLHFVPGNG